MLLPVVQAAITESFLLGCCLLLVAGHVAPSRGAEWTSPDGVIKVTEPDAATLPRMENPPAPFLIVWMSADETLRLGVMQANFPEHKPLIRSAVDEGFVEEFAGSITASTTMTSNGHEIWVTSISGSNASGKVNATQAIVRVNDSVYKIMAMSVGDGSVDEASIQPFLESIQVTGPPHPGGIAGGFGADASMTSMTSDEKFQNVSYLLGRAVGMVLMILLVVWVVGLFNRKPRRPSPPQFPPGPPAN